MLPRPTQRLSAASTRTTCVWRDPHVTGNIPTGMLSVMQKKAGEKTLRPRRKQNYTTKNRNNIYTYKFPLRDVVPWGTKRVA